MRNAGMPEGEIVEAMSDRAAALRAGDRTMLFRRFQVSVLPFISYDQFQHDFSRHNLTDKIDPAFASENVLMAVPDLGAGDVNALIAQRVGGRSHAVNSAYLETTGTDTFSIAASVRWNEVDAYQNRRIFGR